MTNPSHLFMVRLWLEELSNERSEWRGQVQLVANGETRYFRQWETLVVHMQELLAEANKRTHASETELDE